MPSLSQQFRDFIIFPRHALGKNTGGGGGLDSLGSRISVGRINFGVFKKVDRGWLKMIHIDN